MSSSIRKPEDHGAEASNSRSARPVRRPTVAGATSTSQKPIRMAAAASDSDQTYGDKNAQMRPLRFLQYCGACNRALGREMDIYIYRGESAFCSKECREKGMMADDQRRNPF